MKATLHLLKEFSTHIGLVLCVYREKLQMKKIAFSLYLHYFAYCPVFKDLNVTFFFWGKQLASLFFTLLESLQLGGSGAPSL